MSLYRIKPLLKVDVSLSPRYEEHLFDEGLKVVRGPDWMWDNQDDGEGHVGTIVEVGQSISSSVKLVTVQWDGGYRSKYRVGANNLYDLRTLDNAYLGIIHPSIWCNSCGKKGIKGIRWKCKWCYDYDLCNHCYMSDKHDITHPFLRIQTNRGSSVDVPKREGSIKVQLRGIFSSAKVVRSTDWTKGYQDGGPGNTGIVIRNYGWLDDCDMNVCNVIWSATNLSSKHRIGYSGKMDIEYVQDAADGYYYRDHLPIVGDELRPISVIVLNDTLSDKNSGDCTLSELEAESPEQKTEKGSEKEKKQPKGLALLSQNLECVYKTSQFCDFTLKVKTRDYKVHRTILGAQSPVFASMLQHDMEEKNTGTAVISDCDPDSFEDFLFYIYTGKSERISEKNVVELYKVAEKYDVQDLKHDCTSFLKEGLSVDIICDAISLSVIFQDSKLIEYSTDYFISNAEEIIETVQWHDFMVSKPVIANELYIKALRKKS